MKDSKYSVDIQKSLLYLHNKVCRDKEIESENVLTVGVSNSFDSFADITGIFHKPGIVFNTVSEDVVTDRRCS